MKAVTYTEQVRTKGHDECLDITEQVQAVVERAKIHQGLATVFVTGSTAGVTTIEFEPWLVRDLKEAVEQQYFQPIFQR